MDRYKMKVFNEASIPEDNWSEAFDYCREADRPVTVIVNNEIWKLFPSGHAQLVQRPPASHDTPGIWWAEADARRQDKGESLLPSLP